MAPRFFWPLLGALALVVAFEAVGEVDHSLAGREIAEIVIDRHELFDKPDDGELGWPYRLANAVNPLTHEGFIRGQLLFAVGDPYDPEIAEESARKLRSLGFLQPVTVEASLAQDGRVIVTVMTRDQWTMQLGGDIDIFGSRTESGASYIDKNFLGSGREIRVEWADDKERSSLKTGYFDPLLFGSRMQLKLRYEELSDGDSQLVEFGQPFYALSAKWAWGVEVLDRDAEEHLWDEGEIVVSGDRELRRLLIWGGLRLPGPYENTRRFELGYFFEETSFGDWYLESDGSEAVDPLDRRISGIRIAYERIQDDFEVLSGFRAWSSQEDLSLGLNYRAELTFAVDAFGSETNELIASVVIEDGWQLSGWRAIGKTWAEGRHGDGGVENLVVGFEIGAGELGPRGWQLRLFAEHGEDLDLDRQLTLGADQGLRGWDPDTFDGTGRAVATAQWRRLLKEDWGDLMSIGVVVFADIGTTWSPRIGEGTDGLRGDIGIGVLGDLTKLGIAQTLRVDLAWPDDGGSPVISVTSSAIF